MANQDNEMLKPYRLKEGDTIGIFTPTYAGYAQNEEMFQNAIKNVENLGFKIKLGRLAKERKTQGYRSAPPLDRAREFMELIEDSEVNALLATCGGANSSSLIPYLDFKEIREARKPICGYSDITSLHLAITKFSGLRTFYSPSLMLWFGEWPDGIPESTKYFLDAVSNHIEGPREFHVPAKFSNHKLSWENDDWKNIPREWKDNPGWKVLSRGECEAPIIPANLNTLMSAAGTNYFPDLSGKILLIEDLDAPQSRTERSLRQLDLMGVFDKIAGLIVGKPETYDQEGAPFDYDDLILEVVGERGYPIVSGFDCSHTVPLLTVPYYGVVRLKTMETVEFALLDGNFAEK